jgi:integrase
VDRDTGKKVQTKRHGRGMRWRVRVRGAATRSFDKRSDADAYDVEVRGQIQQGVKTYDPARGRILFRDYAATWLEQHAYGHSSMKTVNGYLRRFLLPAFGDLPLFRIEHTTVVEWLTKMRATTSTRTGRQLAPDYIGRVYTTLTSIMKAAVADRRLTVSPCADVPMPKVPERPELEVWEDGTVDAILAALPDRQHAVALTSATCGHRQGEAFAVTKGDIRTLRKELIIAHQVQRVNGQLALLPPKGGKVRTVPLPDVTAAALALHLSRYPTITVRCVCHAKDHELLFHHDGKPLRAGQWNADVWHPALNAAGLDHADDDATGQHQLRHYAASVWIAGGATMTEVQRWLGHKSITITERYYAHLFRRAAERGRRIMDDAFANRGRSLSSSANAGAYQVRTAEIN